jgi:hypothetical protein
MKAETAEQNAMSGHGLGTFPASEVAPAQDYVAHLCGFLELSNISTEGSGSQARNFARRRRRPGTVGNEVVADDR